MLKQRRVNRWILLVLAILASLSVYAMYIIKVSMPMTTGVVESSLLLERVEITRDEYGIPRLVGKNQQDVYFAQGYVHAQERLFQMLLMKHMFSGRMSEIFGEKTIKVDQYMRYLNIENLAQKIYGQFSECTKDHLNAYAAGVNQYIQENRTTIEERLLGFKAEPWRPEDSIIMQKAMAFDLSRHWPVIMKNTALAAKYGTAALDEVFPYESLGEPSVLDTDLKRHHLPYLETPKEYPDGPEVPPAVVSSFGAFAELSHAVLAGLSADETASSGSNVWAVGNTDTGLPYVASDPHLSYRAPNTFYLIDMQVGDRNVVGASIPGAPGVIIGRNDFISWGFTNGKLAQCDIFYAKDISGKKERTEIIKVAGGESVTMTYQDSDYGVLISEENAPYEVAMNWTGLSDNDTTLEAIYGFNQAMSVSMAKRYIPYFHTPAQNLVLADDRGNYGLYILGNVPIREHSGRIAVPATEVYKWKESVPTREMPFVENPPRGYVMNANNDVVSEHYGYNLSRLDFDNLRAVRLVKLLQLGGKFTEEATRMIQMDNEDQKWMVMKDALMNTTPRSDLAKQALDVLSQWDGQAIKSSYEISIFSVWMREISAKIYLDISSGLPKWAKPEYSDLFVRNSIQNNATACLMHISCDELLSSTLEDTVKKLSKHYGTDDLTKWTWDKSHQALFKHPIFKKVPLLKIWSQRSVLVDGARDTLNRSRWYSSKKGFKAIEGACLRMITNMRESYGRFIIPMGQSGSIFSTHYDDLLPIWAEGQQLTLPREEHGQDQLILVPKP